MADLKATPSENAEAVSQVLFGEIVMVFEEVNGWAWVQAQGDRYVGYVYASSLGSVDDAPTHLVAVPRTPAYAEADLRSPVRAHFSMGSQLTVVGMAQTRGTAYGLLRDGLAVVSSHLQPATFRFDDYVAVAERFLETPYVWAGRSGFGFDCSGLVQLAMLMCGRSVLRDTDMQAASIGRAIDPGADDQGLQRGDLVFLEGPCRHHGRRSVYDPRQRSCDAGRARDADRCGVAHRAALRTADRVSPALDPID